MPIDPTGVTEALGIAQGIYGAINANATKKRISTLLNQRTAYSTPDEVFQILNATQSNAQGDTQTRDFQTNQLDTGFSGVLNTAQLLGGDPNTLSSLFDQKMQGIMQIGQQFHTSNMEAFGKYLGALNTVAENKAAEWQSQQDILKDKLQAEGVNLQNSYANIGSGVNAFIGGLSATEQMKLYKQQQANVAAANSLVTPLDTTIGTTSGGGF